MGNALPACLAQQGATALLPAMKPSSRRQRLISIKLLVRAVHKLKKRPATAGINDDKMKIGDAAAKSWSSSSISEAEVAAHDGKEGGLGELEVMRRKVNSNPKGNVLRSRLHGRAGHRKGVVRVKVVLTKEEAARLLTLTVGGGGQKTTAAQIVAEIKRMEVCRANAAAAWRPALESIPEESS